ncbi:hypothetical protein HMPREF1563_0068 [Providencia alcalifaciens 205/92]|uniref:Uncharacterized protein n=1 Tax=Providencia alcalifaciens 205/92 TaxID=1256988 RepID=A0AAV3M395_9GAMM|nr:hypothetical protein HMPREF1563_0068 [Providencia alcalifaciens 205/92]
MNEFHSSKMGKKVTHNSSLIEIIMCENHTLDISKFIFNIKYFYFE